MSDISTSPSSKISVWHEREWWFAIGGCALILAVNLARPLHHDNALYQSIAWQWVEFGRKLYVGTFDQNFPGILYFHAISCLLFGTSEIGFRVLETALHLLEAMGIYYLVRRSHKPLTALTAALLSCAIYLSGSDWSVGQRDAFAMVALVFATIMYFRLRDHPLRTAMQLCIALVIGLLMGLVILLRPTYALFAIWLGVIMLLTLRERRLFIATVYTIGAIGAVAASFWPYLAMPGMMDFIYTALVKFNMDVYGTSKYRRTPWQADAWKHWSLVIIAVTFSLWVGMRSRSSVRRKDWIARNTELLLIAGYLAGAFISIVWMGKYFRTHFEPLYQFSVILLAVSIERYFRANDKYRTIACIALLFVSLALFYPWKIAKFYYQAVRSNAHDRLAFVAAEQYPDALSGYRKQVELASYIRLNSKSSDRVEFACADPWLSYRTELELTSKFTSVMHIVITKPDGSYPQYEQEWQQEFLDSIRTIRPKFFVTALGPTPAQDEFLPDVPSRSLEAIPGYKEMLNSNYSLDTTIGWWLVYRVKPFKDH